MFPGTMFQPRGLLLPIDRPFFVSYKRLHQRRRSQRVIGRADWAIYALCTSPDRATKFVYVLFDEALGVPVSSRMPFPI